ncbi:hypothetical protein GEMRC1_010870 [Eukaryota sp. GEM-RC1]
MFDPKTPDPCFTGKAPGPSPVIVHDLQGFVFASIVGKNLSLFDSRSPAVPFSNFNNLDPRGCPLKDVSFSPDGKYLLLTTQLSDHLLVDSFNGNVQHVFPSVPPQGLVPPEIRSGALVLGSSFTADSNHVSIGTLCGTIQLFNVSDGKHLQELCQHITAIEKVTHTRNRNGLVSIEHNGSLSIFKK